MDIPAWISQYGYPSRDIPTQRYPSMDIPTQKYPKTGISQHSDIPTLRYPNAEISQDSDIPTLRYPSTQISQHSYPNSGQQAGSILLHASWLRKWIPSTFNKHEESDWLPVSPLPRSPWETETRKIRKTTEQTAAAIPCCSSSKPLVSHARS